MPVETLIENQTLVDVREVNSDMLEVEVMISFVYGTKDIALVFVL